MSHVTRQTRALALGDTAHTNPCVHLTIRNDRNMCVCVFVCRRFAEQFMFYFCLTQVDTILFDYSERPYIVVRSTAWRGRVAKSERVCVCVWQIHPSTDGYSIKHTFMRVRPSRTNKSMAVFRRHGMELCTILVYAYSSDTHSRSHHIQHTYTLIFYLLSDSEILNCKMV